VTYVRERQQVVRRRPTGPPAAGWRRAGLAALVALAAASAITGLAGCAKMDQALDRQWMVVDFSPNTSVATALQIRTACSHIQDTPPLPLPKQLNQLNVMYGVEYNTTNSSPAQLAELQVCLGKFKSVLGVDPEDTGDEGS
jgi:hypothetical protein